MIFAVCIELCVGVRMQCVWADVCMRESEMETK